ncbi:MAG: hypothetical protein HYX51_06450 [Chloroflexi bacterium]|nr:hypothetical protein [Chloroflexota bacterium]
MSEQSPLIVEKRIHLPRALAERLSLAAESEHTTEDAVIEKALDVLFAVNQVLAAQSERGAWSSLSDDALRGVWDNDHDAAYDNWRDLYGIPAR